MQRRQAKMYSAARTCGRVARLEEARREEWRRPTAKSPGKARSRSHEKVHGSPRRAQAAKSEAMIARLTEALQRERKARKAVEAQAAARLAAYCIHPLLCCSMAAGFCQSTSAHIAYGSH